MPACSLSRPTMNPVVSWMKMMGSFFWLQSMMNRGSLVGGFGVDHGRHVHGRSSVPSLPPGIFFPVLQFDWLATIPQDHPPMRAYAADDRCPELESLYSFHALVIDDAGAGCPSCRTAGWGSALEDRRRSESGFIRRFDCFVGIGPWTGSMAWSACMSRTKPFDAGLDHRAHESRSCRRSPRASGCTAEFLAVDLLPDRGLYQGRPGKVEPAALGHQQRVAEDRKVASTRRRSCP